VRIGVVGLDANEYTTHQLMSAARRMHHTPVLVEPSRLVSVLNMAEEGLVLDDEGLVLDGVIVRDIGAGTCEHMGFRLDCIRRLEHIPVLNPPDAIFACANKHIAHHMLSSARIPSPPTAVVQSEKEAMRWVERLGEVVLKPQYGYEGRGIVRVRAHQPDAERCVQEAMRVHHVLLVQQLIPSVGDTRVLVVGDKVAGCVRRVPRKGGWLSNLAQGGSAHQTRCSPTMSRLALSSARAVGAAFAGVDIVQHTHTGEHYVLEVNATPSFRAVSELCGTDPASMVVGLLVG